MLTVVPPAHLVQTQGKGKDNVAAKAMEAVSLAGCARGTSYQGLEKALQPSATTSVGDVRSWPSTTWTCAGSPLKISMAGKLEQASSHDVRVKSIVDALACKGGLDTFKKLGLVMHRTVINPGEAFFIPMCSWLLERTIGDETVIGLRTACLLSTRRPHDSLQLFVTNYKKVHGEDGVVNFWAKVLGLLPPSPAK